MISTFATSNDAVFCVSEGYWVKFSTSNNHVSVDLRKTLKLPLHHRVRVRVRVRVGVRNDCAEMCAIIPI